MFAGLKKRNHECIILGINCYFLIVKTHNHFMDVVEPEFVTIPNNYLGS